MKVYAFEPGESDFPRVRSLVVIQKSSETGAEEPTETVSYYLGSRLPGSAAQAARQVRGHWAGCEIRNHWVRDALWNEDRTRSKNWKLNANLAILRAGLIALRAECVPDRSWPALFELCAYKPAIPFRLVTQHRFTW